MKAIGDAYAQALKDGAPAEIQPRLDYAPYRSSVLRHPTKEPAPRGPGNHRAVLAGVRAHGRARAGSGPHHRAQRRAAGRTHRGLRPRARRRRTPRRRPARRDLAGERRRPLHPQARPAPGTARPQLHRRRPLHHRRGRLLQLHHHQARRLPVEEPPQRLAARPTSTSPCSGTEFTQRIVTQMYFPGDQLFPLDPILHRYMDQYATNGSWPPTATSRPVDGLWRTTGTSS